MDHVLPVRVVQRISHLRRDLDTLVNAELQHLLRYPSLNSPLVTTRAA